MTKKFMVFDTETTGTLECPLMFDIGWAIIDLEGNVYKTASYVVADIFLDDELMSNAYFAEKIPQYWEDIKAGKRELRKLSTIKRAIAKDCAEYGVTIAAAHNARFDYRSTATTQRYMTSSKYRYFLPYGVELWDTLKMARKAFQTEDYDTFCYENNYLTKRNQKRFTAEILFRFLTGNNDFEEAHTALEDVMIEKEILLECIRRGVEDGRLW